MAAPKPLALEIIDLEEATWRALQKSGAGMMSYVTSDCIMQFPLGMKLTATSDPSVSDVLHSPAFVPWKTFELLDIDVQALGAEGALISYRAVATRPPAEKGGRDAEFEALCSTGWRWEGEEKGWKVCFHQQTLAN